MWSLCSHSKLIQQSGFLFCCFISSEKHRIILDVQWISVKTQVCHTLWLQTSLSKPHRGVRVKEGQLVWRPASKRLKRLKRKEFQHWKSSATLSIAVRFKCTVWRRIPCPLWLNKISCCWFYNNKCIKSSDWAFTKFLKLVLFYFRALIFNKCYLKS